MKIIPVILSGGSGTRLWPLSRKAYPKQYLSLAGDNTMLQETLLRLHGLDNLIEPIVICNVDHRFLVAEQLKQININNPTILLEPIGRNTAPAIAAAAFQAIKEENKDATLLVLSADHIIQNISAFHKAISLATKQTQSGKLVTFGVKPNHPNTGYGYIKYTIDENKDAYEVEKFVEKPDQKNAKLFLEQGEYLWNSGMFMFQIHTLINELNTHFLDILKSVGMAVDNATQDLDFVRLEENAFMSSPNKSIDYALMEKSSNLVVIPLDSGWRDVGSWNTLYDIGDKDKNGNVIKGDVITEQTVNSYVHADNHFVVTIGIKDLVIVDTPNSTLIASKSRVQEVNKIVEKLQIKGREELLYHRKVYRPWGWFDSIETGKHFQVKKLHVNSGAKLSLQKHQKRAEHWVVIKGIATVTNGEEVFTLSEGQSTYIPVGTKHSLENLNDKALEIIEVQSGIYLGEDDIVRFEDIYGRM